MSDLGRLTTVEPSGTITIQPIDKEPATEQLHEIIGGYIEIVPGFDRFIGRTLVGTTAIFENDPCIAFCNEEGKLQELPMNVDATALWWAALGRLPTGPQRGTDYLVGNVVIITGDKILREMRGP